MSYKDITVGEKLAKATAIRYIRSPNKHTPGFEVEFKFEEPTTGNMETLNWQGWLTGGAMQISVDMVTNVLGWNGNDDHNPTTGLFTDPNALDWNRQVKLVVEMEKYTSRTGEEKTSAKIRYVNPLGGSVYAGKAPEITKVEQSALKAAFLAAKQSKGQSAPAQVVKKEEVPF